MEKTNEHRAWPPDHGISKGYPFDEVKSVIHYPPDRRFTKDVSLDDEDDTMVYIDGEPFKHRMLKKMTTDLVDCDRALAMAELQISDMMKEDPFIPEDYGFECMAKPQSVKDVPVRVWGSKYDDKYSLYKVFGTDYDWVLLKKREDNTFDEIPLYLPCTRIAYGFFVAAGIKVEETQKEADFVEHEERAPETQGNNRRHASVDDTDRKYFTNQ